MGTFFLPKDCPLRNTLPGSKTGPMAGLALEWGRKSKVKIKKYHLFYFCFFCFIGRFSYDPRMPEITFFLASKQFHLTGSKKNTRLLAVHSILDCSLSCALFVYSDKQGGP